MPTVFAVRNIISPGATSWRNGDVPVRFSDDRMEVNRATFLAGEAPSVPLVEIREG